MDIQQGKSVVVTLVPEAPMGVPVAAAYDRRGAELVPSGSISCAASGYSATVVSDPTNTRSRFEVSTVSGGLSPGLFVRVTDPAWGTAIAEVSGVEGDFIRCVEPLPDIPAAGSTIVGLNVSVTVPTGATSALGVGNVLEVTDSSAPANVARLAFAVVRFPFQGPCLARHVRERIARGFPGELLRDEQFHRRVADEVNRQIRARLLAAQNYPSRYWDPQSLASIRPAMLRLVLADQHGLREGGSTRDDYLDQAEREVEARVRDVLKSVELYDADGDGKLDDTETSGVRRWTMRLTQ